MVEQINSQNETNQNRPEQPAKAVVDLEINLAANQRIDIMIQVPPDQAMQPVVQIKTTALSEAQPPKTWQLAQFFALAPRRLTLDWSFATPRVLFGCALALYLVLQFVDLPSFPIYFFCDEAVNPVLASDFIRDNFRNHAGVFFPTFFKNGGQYCLGPTVYMQMVAFVFFGKSIWVTRGLFVLISALTAVFLALIARDMLKNRYWWSVPLWLAAIPTWFLHARGAFEYAPMVAFYAGFIYFYLCYRMGRPDRLYLALIFGALAFYTYTPGQLIMVVSGLFLLISDARYHWQRRRTAFRGLLLLLLLAAPLARFWLSMPDEYFNRLDMYASYWASDISTMAKLGNYFSIYLSGLNPLSWFFPHAIDTPIHTMRGYGHIHWIMLPFFMVGLWQALRKWKMPEMRVLLAALLAAPAGAAMADLHVNRMLTIVIPALLLGLVGKAAAQAWLQKRRPLSSRFFIAGFPAALALFGVFMTADALTNGPTWYTDYGLNGMQWGARQVYAAAQAYIRQHPERTLYISPNWTFQSEVMREFFAPGEQRIRVGAIDGILSSVDRALNQKAFVLMPEEYHRIQDSGRFQQPQIDEVIHYPDGRPGFYFVRLAYVDDIEAIIRSEQEERWRKHQTAVDIHGQRVMLRHTAIEGDLNSLFDGNPDTLVKTQGINPMVIELEFAQPVMLSGVIARVGAEAVEIGVDIQGDGFARNYTVQAGEHGPYKNVPVDFGSAQKVVLLRFTLRDRYAPETSFVHLWELTLDFAP
jgi:4-amino-4-deoxy-L-arabinose transferase-like glycosyltransferase